YSGAFPDAVLAQGRGRDVLLLHKRDTPSKRADGKRASYEVEHRWLSVGCERESDQAWACVQGSDITLWQRKELDGLFQAVKRGEANIFNHFFLSYENAMQNHSDIYVYT